MTVTVTNVTKHVILLCSCYITLLAQIFYKKYKSKKVLKFISIISDNNKVSNIVGISNFVNLIINIRVGSFISTSFKLLQLKVRYYSILWTFIFDFNLI